MSTLYDIVTYFLLSNQTKVFTPTDFNTIRAIGSLFYNNDLIKLILTYVFNPTQLGFDINNEEINKKLLERILNSLKSMTTHLADQL
ncbi:unnamed protein product [Rotaria sp. Silwood1]|nr:unnamed protein product [Rotaria sp. Silwood1]CAF3593083.1 unnamed protein product [Rotaria sp. Silwood1]